MPALLSPICSSFAVCITAIKFVISAWRLYYECTRKPNPVTDPQPVRELRLWLDTGMSAIFVILSGLLLVFSFVGPEETGLQILLSLAGGSLIVYQGGYLSLYCDNWSRWFWLALLICFLITAGISIPIALCVGYTGALKITLLSYLLAEYVVIFIAYLVVSRRQTFSAHLLLSPRRTSSQVVQSLILWNIGLCCVASAGALASLLLYVKGQVDFITSLWICVAAAMVWVVWLVWKQWKALQRARSPKEGLELKGPGCSQGSNEELGVPQQDLLRQDSMNSITQLVVPSATHLREIGKVDV